MISTEEYRKRRQTLANKLPSNAVAFIPAATETIRNGDAHYPFRQDSDFYYLTGFCEPDALLLITSFGVNVLFNRERNPSEEAWTGKRLGQDHAPSILGVDEAYSLLELDQRLPDILADKQFVFYAMGQHSHWADRLLKAWSLVKGRVRSGIKAPEAFCDVAPLLGEMRLFKSQSEWKLMQRAADITVKAHQQAMKACLHSEYEYELEAEIVYEAMRQGCRSMAYSSIVAGGENACVLHYIDNNQALKANELVLVDAGAEFQHYAADVTRTYPVNGRFRPEQRDLYDLVLQAQRAGMACVRPGCAWGDIQTTMVRILTDGLLQLGILKGDLSQLIESGAYKTFYSHSSGHWLGLDVHDCGQYKIDKQWRLLEPDMVLTVEPGLYIPLDSPGVDKRWQGMGIRIEDDLRVTSDGYDNLTAALAVEVDEIEALMRG